MKPIRLSAALLLLLSVVRSSETRGAGPADRLLDLVPADASATLAVEDLKGHFRAVSGSDLVQGLRKLPAVQAWRESPRHAVLERSCAEIEQALGAPLASLRDDVLGEAVVLAIHVAPGQGLDQARGLLLVRPHDRALLERLLERLNSREEQGGPLLEVAQRSHHGQVYNVRRFQPGTKPDESYAFVGSDLFAWSNSEALVQGVLDRQGGGAGLGSDPRFRAVRAKLPARALASLYVNPRFLERALAADTRTKTPPEQRVHELLARNLGAVQYIGAALEWRNGLLLHTQEMIDPGKLDEPLRRWASLPGGRTAGLLARVPATALAVAAGEFALTAIFDELVSLVPPESRLTAQNAQVVLQGLFLGKDVRTEVLPCLGPGLLLYVDAPAPGTDSQMPLPIVLAVSLSDEVQERGVAAALDNALRTVLALYTLDPKRRELALQIQEHETGGVRVTSLCGDRILFSYAIGNGLLVFGNSAEAVAALCTGKPDTALKARLDRLRATYFPGADTFAFADLPRIAEVLASRRDVLAKRLAARSGCSETSARHDLDQAIALVSLFDAAIFSSAISPDFTSVHRTLGLIARETQGGQPGASPPR